MAKIFKIELEESQIYALQRLLYSQEEVLLNRMDRKIDNYNSNLDFLNENRKVQQKLLNATGFLCDEPVEEKKPIGFRPQNQEEEEKVESHSEKKVVNINIFELLEELEDNQLTQIIEKAYDLLNDEDVKEKLDNKAIDDMLAGLDDESLVELANRVADEIEERKIDVEEEPAKKFEVKANVNKPRRGRPELIFDEDDE